ncbi:MAG TPA: bifunctional adenosylcobinamide kinase/adenosylcobinamide-phosphate guanylyltransferase [Candidatus Blautia faecavium]|uniref:Adenosylcobinamide kinase n=1 Tax=Candidatus Blautia faecavium TaxID=2838487 RepID=A0A9D2LVJ5_9FIRM|nr:bifunctional adenosylcobinamide kinase/adenosylcobinamide-phosphate guanylyltransferase [Candidatus Blautia faecavium]
MELIIGGAFQGKSAYAREKYRERKWVSGDTAKEEDVLQAGGILAFQKYIRRELEDGRDVTRLAEKLARENPDVVIVCDEVGYGVVPIDAFERRYREAVGRVCIKLAAKSRRVTRVLCGIGTVIKDA